MLRHGTQSKSEATCTRHYQFLNAECHTNWNYDWKPSFWTVNIFNSWSLDGMPGSNSFCVTVVMLLRPDFQISIWHVEQKDEQRNQVISACKHTVRVHNIPEGKLCTLSGRRETIHALCHVSILLSNAVTIHRVLRFFDFDFKMSDENNTAGTSGKL